jgi:hypothetical protein
LIESNRTKGNWTTAEIADGIQFSKSEKKRLKLYREIDESNKKLQDLMSQSRAVAPIVQMWKKRRTDPLNRIRVFADTLHNALITVSKCQCPSVHQISL